MLNPRLAWEYVAYLAFRLKYTYPTPLWVVAIGAVTTTFWFHALAAYTPDKPFWWIVLMNTVTSGAVSLLAWAFFGGLRGKDASLKWCLAWTAVAATTSLMLAATQ